MNRHADCGQMSVNQRRLFSLLAVESMQNAAPLFVRYRQEAGDTSVWSEASGFFHLLHPTDPTARNKVFVSTDDNRLLMTINLPWREMRAADVLKPAFLGRSIVQTLRLYRCRDYFSDRDIFTNEIQFWFDDVEPFLEVTTGGFFSEELRNFVARFPQDSNIPLGDLATND